MSNIDKIFEFSCEDELIDIIKILLREYKISQNTMYHSILKNNKIIDILLPYIDFNTKHLLLVKACEKDIVSLFIKIVNSDTNRELFTNNIYITKIIELIYKYGSMKILKYLGIVEKLYNKKFQMNIIFCIDYFLSNYGIYSACNLHNFEMLKYMTLINKICLKKDEVTNHCKIITNICKIGNIKSLKYLLSLNEFFMDSVYLYNAFKYNNFEIVKYLLSFNKLYKLLHEYPVTYLEAACISNNIKLVKYILSFDIKDIHGSCELPLQAACHNNNLEMIEYLLSFEKKYGKFNIEFSHKLYSYDYKNLDIIKLLLRYDNNNKIKINDLHPNVVDRLFNELKK